MGTTAITPIARRSPLPSSPERILTPSLASNRRRAQQDRRPSLHPINIQPKPQQALITRRRVLDRDSAQLGVAMWNVPATIISPNPIPNSHINVTIMESKLT